jgi:Protein of unknown function (DUF3606)
MTDNLNRKGPDDAARINIHEAYELTYWSKKLGAPKEKIIEAVKLVGAMVKDVKKELKRNQHT